MGNYFTTLIMAAGMGKRMKSDLPKVLHRIAGKPMVHHVVDLARKVGSDRVILIIGYKRELVVEETRDSGVEWVIQAEQNGTGDAVEACRSVLEGYDGDVLVLSGDVPLLRAESIRDALAVHHDTQASATVFTFEPADPTGYGRVIRGAGDEVLRIVEHKDADRDELAAREVNGGIYFFRSRDMFDALRGVSNENASGEYYITDTIGILRAMNKRVSAYLVRDRMEMAGVNSAEQLGELEHYFLQHRQE